ncbi:MAG: hypothetical protein DMF72_12850 [Acidobacteria bacterium]|nr:MAG: hypothetical protein DMF72_12850 [Acidobacteriota bacterium]
MLQVIVFGLENGIPTYVAMDLSPGETLIQKSELPPRAPELVTTITGCPLKYPATAFLMYPIGHREAIDRIEWGETTFWKAFGDVLGVRFLVLLESVTASAYVGEPIDLLRITKTGACWYEHKNEGQGCETQIPKCESEKPSTPKSPSRKRR